MSGFSIPVVTLARLSDTPSGSRSVRRDALPESANYEDNGCEVAPRCLECPLPCCRFDVVGGKRAMLNDARDREIRHLRRTTALTVEELAERFEVGRRTVFRALAMRK
jgi:hypothetical protein